jgi:hypothetical protein
LITIPEAKSESYTKIFERSQEVLQTYFMICLSQSRVGEGKNAENICSERFSRWLKVLLSFRCCNLSAFSRPSLQRQISKLVSQIGICTHPQKVNAFQNTTISTQCFLTAQKHYWILSLSHPSKMYFVLVFT